jgi:hypothetical protein
MDAVLRRCRFWISVGERRSGKLGNRTLMPAIQVVSDIDIRLVHPRRATTPSIAISQRQVGERAPEAELSR